MFGGGQLNDAKSVLQKTKIRYVRGGVLGEGVDQVAYNRDDAKDADRFKSQDVRFGELGKLPMNPSQPSSVWGRRCMPLEGVNESWERPDWGWKGWNTALDVQKFSFTGWAEPKSGRVFVDMGGPINAMRWKSSLDGYRQTDAFSTHANFHPYHWYSNPDGRGTSKMIGLWQDAETPDKKGAVETVRRVMQNPKKRLVATEWGWSNAPKEGDPFHVPEAARAKFYARAMLESFQRRTGAFFSLQHQ
jgi:hypothetical protein